MNDRHPSGFTLLEMVVVIIILGLIAGVGTPVLMGAFQSFRIGSIVQEADVRARLAMERLLRELRGAQLGSLTAGTGLSAITFTDQDDTSVTFQFDADTGTLSRGGATLAEGVSALTFDVVTGLDPVVLDNDPLPSITVTMTITIPDPVTGNSQGLSLIGGVSPVNP